MSRRKSENPVDQLETDTPQHPLAEPALVGVDVEFEEAVQHHERQEDKAERHQHLKPVELQALEEFDMPDQRNVEGDVHEGLRGVRILEAITLDRPVDDLLRQIEGQEVGDHRDGNDSQDPKLLQPRVRPDIAGEAFFHC